MWGWRWWVFSDGGLVARVAIGVTILAIWATADLRRNGPNATRWREYAFLLVAAVAAAAYGAVNDLITSSISWEYFYYGKGLCDSLGPVTPPTHGALAWGAAKIGMESSWSAGVLAAAMLLFTSSYRGRNASAVPLSMARLIRWLGVVMLGALAGGIIGAIAGRVGSYYWMPADLRGIGGMDDHRAALFMTTWGIHAGSYVGAALATICCLCLIRVRRKSGTIGLSRK